MTDTPNIRLQDSTRLAIGALKGADYNPRHMPAEEMAKLRQSLQKFGLLQPIVARAADGLIIGGHQRLAAYAALLAEGGLSPEEISKQEVPVVLVDNLSDAEAKVLNLALNKISGDWDTAKLTALLSDVATNAPEVDILLAGFNQLDLDAMLQSASAAAASIPSGTASTAGAPQDASATPPQQDTNTSGALADRFLVPPFSVLDARQGYWQDRKRSWISIGLRSELGRGGNLLKFSEVVNSGGYNAAGNGKYDGKVTPEGRAMGTHQGGAAAINLVQPRKQPANAHLSPEAQKSLGFYAAYGGAGAIPRGSGGDAKTFGAEGNIGGSMTGTSIFDPVLCELAYRWWAPPGGQVLDPFAGGSVRGIVASRLGYRYTGLDLRPEQVEANRAQAAKLCPAPYPTPTWITGNSCDLLTLTPHLKDGVDFIFSCPPYGDLEVYSDDPADLSTMTHEQFVESYRLIIRSACDRLRNNRLACFVVGDFRDKRTGAYRDFVSETIRAFKDAGLQLYNEAILVTAVGTLPLRVGKQFGGGGRKLGKTHQNILVFLKGDAKAMAAELGPVVIPEDAFGAAPPSGDEDVIDDNASGSD